MKRLFNRYIAGMLATLLALASCSKNFVTKTPADSVPAGQALTSPDALFAADQAVYAQLRNTTIYGRDFPVIGDLMGDNVWLQSRNSGRYIDQYTYTVTITDAVPNEMWSGAYTAIERCNEIIDANVKGSAVDSLKAPAYALRALTYFKLVTSWASNFTDDSSKPGVPLVLHYNPTYLPARASIGTVYNQIVSDLKAAMKPSVNYTSSNYISHYAIEGLLARVYLYMGDYADAKTAAIDVINNSPFTLVSPQNLVAFWNNPANHNDGVEVMFELDCDPINNNGFDDIGGIYFNGYADLYCSSQLFNLYSATDVRASLIIQGQTARQTPAYVVVKYPNTASNDKDNLKVIRLAEVYLIAAEAAARTNDPTTAQTYLNGLMAQRDPSFTGYTDVGQALIDDIVQERRKELAFEGDRLFDMNRLHLPINRVNDPGSYPAGTGNANLNIPYPDNRRIAPIPQQELLANPSLAGQQNPGYGN